MLPTAVESVVSFYGSFATRPDLAAKQDVLQDLAVSLLDKGTTARNKFDIAHELESRGAEIRFHSMATRIAFSGKCLNKDVSSVLAICAEQLRDPTLDESEYEKVLPRLQASVMQSMESTATQAGTALRRMLFNEDHPNYAYAPEREMEILSATDPENVSEYYQERSGANEFILVVVGDFDVDEVIDSVRLGFASWQSRPVVRSYDLIVPKATQTTVHVPMRDKYNIDVRLGHAINLKRGHKDYLPLYLGVFILGGNFSSRLMDTIRDREGLTYGIYSQLSSVAAEFCGYFLVRATFSSESLARGVERTNDLIREFAEGGVSTDELSSKKRTVAGSYKVGLASTGSLARTIAGNIISGLGINYVDEYPELIHGVTKDEVNAAIESWIDTTALRTATAGSIPEDD